MLGGLARTWSARSLEDRVVVVTGATAGVGRQTALRLARGGAIVVGVARRAEVLAQVAAEESRVHPWVCDITDDAGRAALVEGVLSEHGRIDALVNNVGIGWSGLVEDMTLEQVRRLVETNVVAPIDLTRLVLPWMLARGEGDVVLVASVASWFAVPPLTVYSATKYAVEGFTEGLRREVMARGVRVHSVHPGLVATEFAARSAGEVPGEVDGPPAPGPGMPPDVVAAAIERLLRGRGSHSIAVPRILGATRLTKLPGLAPVTDVAMALGARPLAHVGRMVAERAAGPFQR